MSTEISNTSDKIITPIVIFDDETTEEQLLDRILTKIIKNWNILIELTEGEYDEISRILSEHPNVTGEYELVEALGYVRGGTSSVCREQTKRINMRPIYYRKNQTKLLLPQKIEPNPIKGLYCGKKLLFCLIGNDFDVNPYHAHLDIDAIGFPSSRRESALHDPILERMIRKDHLKVLRPRTAYDDYCARQRAIKLSARANPAYWRDSDCDHPASYYAGW